MLPCGQKLTLCLLAAIILEAVPFCSYAAFSALLPFSNASRKLCSLRVFSIDCDFASITTICQNGCFSVSSSIRKTEKSRVGGGHSRVAFGQKFPGKKEVWNGASSWCNSQFLCHQSSGWSLRTFSRSRRKSHSYMWLKKAMTLLFTCLAFLGSDEFGHAIQTPVYGSCILSRRFV
jgi:hypothetical protein